MKDSATPICSVRWYLNQNLLKKGKQKGTVYLKPEHLARNNNYLRMLSNNRIKFGDERLQMQYMDERYVYQHRKLDNVYVFYLDYTDIGTKLPKKEK